MFRNVSPVLNISQPRGSSNSIPPTNLNQVFSPEKWAMESVGILFENAVFAQLVNRDFEDEFQNFGDVVNTRRPNEAVASRKAPGDPINRQAATATNIAVKLDQHLESSFYLTDEEMSKSFKNLVEEYLRPHTIALASMLDLIVLGQYAQFMQYQAGALGGLTDQNAVQYIANAGLLLNRNKVPMDRRNVVWTPEAEALLIQNPTFHEADKRGDTIGLQTASMGHKLNFDHWMDQNVSQTFTHTVVAEDSEANAAGLTTIACEALSADIPAGAWLSINGRIYQAAALAIATATSIVLTYGLFEAVEDEDEIFVYPCTNAVDNAAAATTYVVGYNKGILIDNASGAVPANTLQRGMIVTFGLVNYTVVRVDVGATEHTIWLDRPLEAALADNTLIKFGPSGGGINPVFHRNAVTLAVRPLRPVMAGAGAIASVASFNGLTMRVTISYDHDAQAHVVTLDFLAGVKVLDTFKGGVILT